MSIGVMTWVWNHSQSRNGARLVLLAIADAASDDGTNAWPSIATLQRKANMKSDRSIQTAIRELVELGELKVKMNAGRNGTNQYTVVMKTPAESAPPQDLPPAESAEVETDAEPDTDTQDPPQNLHPANSAPPQISTETPANSAPEPSLNRPSSSSSKKTRSSPPAKGATGTRIPDNFTITPGMAAWCQSKIPKLSRQRAEEITEEFVDYWLGVPGAKGLKADWPATWRNWIKRKAKEAADQEPSPGAPNRGPGRHQPYQNPTDPNAYSGDL